MSESTALATSDLGGSFLTDPAQFDHAQRVAKLFASSQLVPTTFQNNIANCTVALEMASRQKASPLMVMQNLNVIHGRPSWSSTYIIAAIASCGRFTPLRFVLEDLGEKTVKGVKIRDKSCYAWAQAKDGERLEGAPASIEMAVLEGWFSKTGSKWQTMPELMLRYRAAAFFGRMYAPDVLMGMQTMEEVIDVWTTETPPKVEMVKPRGGKGIAALTQAQVVDAEEPAPTHETPTAPEPDPATPDPEAEAPKRRGRPRKEPEPEKPAEPEAPPAPPAEAEQPKPEPKKEEPKAPPPAATEDDNDLPFPEVARIEIEEIIERATTRGIAYEVRGKGEEKPFYFDGARADIPGEGSLVEVTYENRESLKRPGHIMRIASRFEAL